MKPPFFIIVILCICACFYFSGYILYPKFYGLVLPSVDGIKYMMDLNSLDSNQNMFGFMCALIPLCIYFTWEAIPLYSGDKKTLSVFFIFISIVVAVYIRYRILLSYFTEMVQSLSNKSVAIAFPFQQLDFEWYFAGGVLVGCVISFLAFHNKVIPDGRFRR